MCNNNNNNNNNIFLNNLNFVYFLLDNSTASDFLLRAVSVVFELGGEKF